MCLALGAELAHQPARPVPPLPPRARALLSSPRSLAPPPSALPGSQCTPPPTCPAAARWSAAGCNPRCASCTAAGGWGRLGGAIWTTWMAVPPRRAAINRLPAGPASAASPAGPGPGPERPERRLAGSMPRAAPQGPPLPGGCAPGSGVCTGRCGRRRAAGVAGQQVRAWQQAPPPLTRSTRKRRASSLSRSAGSFTPSASSSPAHMLMRRKGGVKSISMACRLGEVEAGAQAPGGVAAYHGMRRDAAGLAQEAILRDAQAS